jgi:ribosomal protein S27AE
MAAEGDRELPPHLRPPDQSAGTAWECGRCGVPLEVGRVRVAYLDSEQPVDLARCPRCGLVMVPEDLALGRMLEVEQLLEDK